MTTEHQPLRELLAAAIHEASRAMAASGGTFDTRGTEVDGWWQQHADRLLATPPGARLTEAFAQVEQARVLERLLEMGCTVGIARDYRNDGRFLAYGYEDEESPDDTGEGTTIGAAIADLRDRWTAVCSCGHAANHHHPDYLSGDDRRSPRGACDHVECSCKALTPDAGVAR